MAPAEAERGGGFGEAVLADLERRFPAGLSVQQIVELFAGAGEKLTEATFRKYVQLGLLPRSVRVGTGRKRGSQGLYPATVVRRIDEIRRLMVEGYTMEEIAREFLFVRGDIEELSRTLDRVWSSIERTLAERGGDALAARELEDAKAVAHRLVERLDAIESRVSMRARMRRAAV